MSWIFCYQWVLCRDVGIRETSGHDSWLQLSKLRFYVDWETHVTSNRLFTGPRKNTQVFIDSSECLRYRNCWNRPFLWNMGTYSEGFTKLDPFPLRPLFCKSLTTYERRFFSVKTITILTVQLISTSTSLLLDRGPY